MNFVVFKNRRWIILVLLFVLSFLPRAAHHSLYGQHELSGDEVSYYSIAENLYEKNVFVDRGQLSSEREPMYPLFVAFIFGLFGKNAAVVYIVQGAVGAILCIFIYLLAEGTGGRSAALVSWVLASTYLIFIKSETLFLTELSFTFLLILSLYAIKSAWDSEKKFCSLYLGFFTLGLATLTRPVAFFLAFIIAIAYAVSKREPARMKRIKIASIACLVFLAVLSPWVIRNYIVHDEFVFFTTNFGKVLYAGLKPAEKNIYGVWGDDEAFKNGELIKESRQSGYFINESLKFILANPKEVMRLTALKAAYFWSVFDWEIMRNGRLNFQYLFMLPFAFLGIFLLLRNKADPATYGSGRFFLLMPLCYFFAMSLVTYGSPRFRFPVEPFLIILAGGGLVHVFMNNRNKAKSLFFVSSYLFLCLGLYASSSYIKSIIKRLLIGFKIWQ